MSSSNLYPHTISQTPKTQPLPSPATKNPGAVKFSFPPSSDSDPITIPTTPLVTFLERVQETALQTFGKSNFDPKLYVDLSLKTDLKAAEAGLNRVVETGSGLREYIEEYFEGAGEDLVYCEAEDYVAEPEGFLAKVKNEEVRKWALEIHSLWGNLSRKVSGEVWRRPERHTLLPLPELVMVPGSRFREVYYWDSYWVIRGLLASKMYETAKAIVNNLIFLIEEHGYVLNGARAYYTNRSQPPLLSAMVCEIYKKTKDLELAQKSLPSLIKEYKFWNSGIHGVRIQVDETCDQTLSRYYAMWNKPRPESSTIDRENALMISNPYAKQQFYCEVASAAESGWDFSTRWMRDFPNGWAPIQHMIIEGLAKSRSKEARLMAENIAMRWIRTNYLCYKKTKTMHEKYNVEICGDFGGGGEYDPQTGFGWSNGVVLALLEEFGWPEDLSIDCC
ncbi:hypothetical protein F8388_013210 [Cannabis sativa]|uniref:Trehalase n=1 Tax=Cannabis sativa TaxID=3483 RepID=A0A7J6DY70_CANSA|nr:hypothetical protein F8388_013210 [Cannabis sativa]